MYDTVRFILLGLIFAGLFGLWFWSRRQAAGKTLNGQALGARFTILQKRWLDKGTGVCLVEAEDKTFLLAYTAGGGVSWQAIEKTPVVEEQTPNRMKGKSIFPEGGSQ
jgi:hypothetical protein